VNFFRKIELDWVPASLPDLKTELAENEPLWLVNQNRQRNIRVQQHTQSISLRSAVTTPNSGISLEDTHASADTKLAAKLPVTMGILQRISNDLSSDLCRALFARLLPHSVVYRHVDGGAYYKPRDRYHLVVTSLSGSPMSAGDEQVTMREGELWWFDNKMPHDSKNDSEEWRVHLIFDLLPIAAPADA
jgi:hypothetical protein